MRLTREQQALVERNIPLAGHIAAQFRRRGASDPDELRSVALLGLCRAALMFDPTRISAKTGLPARFGTFAGMVIRHTLIAAIGRACKRPPMQSLDVLDLDGKPVFDPPARGDHVAELMVKEELAKMKLTDRQRQIVKMRLDGLTLDQIGGRFGISRERVRQILAKAGQANGAAALALT